MRLGVRTKLFSASALLLAVAVLAVYAVLSVVLDRWLTERIRDDLLVRLSLVEREVATAPARVDGRAGWDRLAGEIARRAAARVTLVRLDGVVLGESDVESATELENHADRPEIVGALATGRGESIRASATVKQRMLYVAKPFVRDGKAEGVVRLAIPLAEVDRALARLDQFLAIGSAAGLAIAMLVSILAVRWGARGVRSLTAAARRMAAGDLAARTCPSGSDEIAELGRALDALAEGLSTTLESLRGERDLVGGILDAMREGVLFVDREQRIVRVNRAFRELFGLADDTEGRFLFETVRHAALKTFLDGASRDETAEIDFVEPSPRHLLARAVEVARPAGGTVAVFFDITHMRRLESIRRDFVANASHELRTPVAAICSASETLVSGALVDPAASARFIEIIQRHAERLRSLVDDLLELARIEGEQPPLKFEAVDAREVARRVLESFSNAALQRQLRLVCEGFDELGHVRADARAFELVLGNLVDNAVKYGAEGTDVVVVAVRDGACARITVEDNGPGIDAVHLPRLFERFYRVDVGRSRDAGGTGLGLSIVKHLVEMMGGTVSVESAPGRGSRFTFTLPFA